MHHDETAMFSLLHPGSVMKEHKLQTQHQTSLSFLYSSRPKSESLTLSQSAGFGMIMAIYPSLSAWKEEG